ncbi:L-ascorbate metabolism protein UlaG, beta-lactamase superfamily [Loktanella sp. DSM 29012]|uniref:MBL fold metallo-hydrolase n=1 Tax=Loktanella gaetbuli TaxID=2881335 RepID=A0ABS8BRE3_9RHOB|nr:MULTISPECIES: MBL fold metallo-hydrolase [Loktanella]MCB5198305.1 MBL fold metallo-hydrolase [Loktanella gaetbuli]SEQ68892.1 L-ascorbate metabolism protein UlaG, beta-lactamase superfamily [Loktanella sp. DSM 29012]
MKTTRRTFLISGAAAGSMTVLPFAAQAAAHTSNVFNTPAGDITVHPVEHASIVLETPVGTIYVDPVGDPSLYADFPRPDLVMITHEHGDHYNVDTLNGVITDATVMFANPAVFDMMPENLQAVTMSIANGETGTFDTLGIEAIPAYNITEERLNFHPEGRDNGYILGFDGFRIYVSGDTEDTPEMRALTEIDLAFVSNNLPFTMDMEAAASAVNEFAPTYVYPYHYRGRDGGTQDPNAFAELVDDAIEVRIGDWYGGDVMPS